MPDIAHHGLLYFKALLFVVTGTLAAGLVLLEHPSWRVAGLLALAIWCFSRAYYFAFSVIERYIDPGFRFAGLWSVIAHLRKRRPQASVHSPGDPEH